MVAIDSAWTKKGAKNRFIVGKLWSAVTKFFEKVDATAAREIKDALYL